MQRRAFTLVEVMVVVLLMGLLAGAVALSLGGDVADSVRGNVVGRIAETDHLARLAARRMGGRTELQIDLDEQLLRYVSRVGEADEHGSHAVRLADAHVVDRVLMGGSSTSAIREIEKGTVHIAMSENGHSASYALRVSTRSDGHRTWLVFAGLTGQVTVLEDEEDAYELFETLSTGRIDAD